MAQEPQKNQVFVEQQKNTVVIEDGTRVTVSEPSNAVTVASPGPKGDPGPVIAAGASTKTYSGGFFPGASMINRINGTQIGTSQQRLYFYWAPVQKELNITGLQIDVAGAGDAGALHRIGLFDYDLQDLSVDYNSFYYFTLRHDFGTLPLDVAGTQSMDLSSSPVVVPPGLYAIGVGSEFTGTIPTLNGIYMSYMSDVPANYTLVSSFVRSYSIPVWSSLAGSGQVTNGFQSTEMIANLAGSIDTAHGVSTVLLQGYMTQD